ncbi:MAG: Dabb family protein [Gemmataceae bacterium]
MPPADQLLVHNVYFSLHDRSPQAKQRLIDACRKWLPNHPGVVYFTCGALAEEYLDREVNVRDWDVGLHIIFQDQAAHDHYQDAAAHHAFIAENKAAWKQVRVFDTVAGQSPTP